MIKYYKILGLTPKADLSEVKKQFRKIMRELHPDLNNNTDLELFHITVDAYNKILNKNNRTFSKNSSFDDITQFYINRFLPDINIKIKKEIFEKSDFFKYAYKEYCPFFKKHKNIKCFKCLGHGYIKYKIGSMSKRISCSNCGGKGKIIECDFCFGNGFKKIEDEVVKDNGKLLKKNVYIFKKKGNIYKKFRSDLVIQII